MAAIIPTVTEIVPGTGQAGYKAVWANCTESDTCVATDIRLAPYTDRSVQIEGTFGSATVIIKGSNDGTNYQNLSDPQGNDISKTTADLEQIEEASIYIKPTFSGGTAQSVTITVLFLGFRLR